MLGQFNKGDPSKLMKRAGLYYVSTCLSGERLVIGLLIGKSPDHLVMQTRGFVA